MERAKNEKKAQKQGSQHGHSHITSTAQIEEVREPQPAPTLILATQPSRAAPNHATVASFGKDGITYRKQQLEPAVKPAPATRSVWPSLNEAREICDKLAVRKTAINLKPLEQNHLSRQVIVSNKECSYNENFSKAHHQLKKATAEAEVAYKWQLLNHLSALSSSCELPSALAWCEDWDNYDNYEANTDGRGNLSLSARLTTPLRDTSREPPVSLGESDMDVEDGIDHQAAFDNYLRSESNEYELNYIIEP